VYFSCWNLNMTTFQLKCSPRAGSGDGVSSTIIWLSRSGSRRLCTLPAVESTPGV
jgi:hypothetical protein